MCAQTRQVSFGCLSTHHLVTTKFPNSWSVLSTADKLTWLQVLLTLSHKYFAHFNRSTCALSVSCHYLGLRGIHLAYSLWNQKQSYSFENPKRTTELASRKHMPLDFHQTEQVSSKPFFNNLLEPKDRLSDRGNFLTQHCTHRGQAVPIIIIHCAFLGTAYRASSIAFTETWMVVFISSS